MTIQKMHIDVRQRLQRIGADFYGQLLPDSIDFWLNRVEDNLVTTMSSSLLRREGLIPGSQDMVQAYTDMLDPIIVKSKRIRASGNTDGQIYSDILFPRFDAIFPPDYDHLISDRSTVIWDCKDFNVSGNSLIETIDTKYCAAFTFDLNHTLKIYTGTTLLYSTEDYSFSEDLSDEERYEIVNHVIMWARENFKNGSEVVELYWEQYGSTYKRSSFIVVTNSETFRDSLKFSYVVDEDVENLILSPSFEAVSPWNISGFGWVINTGTGVATYTAGSGTGYLEQLLATPINTSDAGYVLKFVVDSIGTNLRAYAELSDFTQILIKNATAIGTYEIDIPPGYEIIRIFFRGTDAEGTGSISFVQLSVGNLANEAFAKDIYPKSYAGTNKGTYPNSLQKQEHLYHSLMNPMRKTVYSNPMSSNSSGLLHVFASKRFIVIELVIDYIRKRRRMSLSLNQSTELPKLAEKVIGETVTAMHEAIQSGNFQTSAIEARKSN